MSESGVLGRSLDDLFANLVGRTAIFFDTETTGFNPRLPYRQITQLAAQAIDLGTGKVLDSFERVLTLNPETLDQMEKEKESPPEKSWSIEKVLSFSGYDPSRASQDPLAAATEFSSWLAGFSHPLLVAQNAQFDMHFLNLLLKDRPVRMQVFDFLKFSKLYLEPMLLNLRRAGVPEADQVLKDLWDEKRDKVSFAQQKLGKAFGVSSQGAHVAMHDVEQLVELTQKVLEFVKQHQPQLGADAKRDFIMARAKWNRRRKRFRGKG